MPLSAQSSPEPLLPTPQSALPKNRRLADPLALSLLDWTLTEQHFVYRAAPKAVGAFLAEDYADALDAARACAHANGSERCPSRDAYRSWHSKQPAEMGWPSDVTIADTFDGWVRFRAFVDDEPLAQTEALYMRRLGSTSEECRLLAGIRAWHEQRPDPELCAD